MKPGDLVQFERDGHRLWWRVKRVLPATLDIPPQGACVEAKLVTQPGYNTRTAYETHGHGRYSSTSPVLHSWRIGDVELFGPNDSIFGHKGDGSERTQA